MSNVPVINAKSDISGVIVSGGVSQILMVGGKYIKGFEIQNTSSGDLWINELGVPAVIGSPSIKIPPDALYETSINWNLDTTVYIIGATTNQTFTARSWE